ncbi:hypothetical protein BaRGS_00011432 [Batillaria attramentaria]|uniref:Uncharacterized protein n=1 Tax=Batillaria attramentaria TaxID=370345 RepID=A0ABD0LDT1_9CAEN
MENKGDDGGNTIGPTAACLGLLAMEAFWKAGSGNTVIAPEICGHACYLMAQNNDNNNYLRRLFPFVFNGNDNNAAPRTPYAPVPEVRPWAPGPIRHARRRPIGSSTRNQHPRRNLMDAYGAAPAPAQAAGAAAASVQVPAQAPATMATETSVEAQAEASAEAHAAVVQAPVQAFAGVLPLPDQNILAAYAEVRRKSTMSLSV